MGIIKQGILGGFSGKVGSVVGTSWKGRAVIKALPLSVSNPQTAAQTTQRSIFSYVAVAGSLLLIGYIQKVLNLISGNITGYNYFVKQNKSAFTSGGAFVPNSFKVGGGNRPTVKSISTATHNANGSLDIPFIRITDESAAYDSDLSVFVVHNSTQDFWAVSPGTELKSTLTTNAVPINAGDAFAENDICIVYPCFISSDGRYCSIESGGTSMLIN